MDLPQLTLSWILACVFCIPSILISFQRFCSASKSEKRRSFARGPRPLPIFGNIFCFFTLRKNPDQTLLQLAHQYGALCMLWFGASPVLLVSSARVAKDLLHKAGGHFQSLREAPRLIFYTERISLLFKTNSNRISNQSLAIQTAHHSNGPDVQASQKNV